MSIQTIALLLLLARLVSMVFIISVLRTQLRLIRLPISANLKSFRKVLLLVSLAIFVGNLIPIAIDTLTLFVETDRPNPPAVISIMYVFSNSIIAMLSAIFIWLLYRLAATHPLDIEDDKDV